VPGRAGIETKLSNCIRKKTFIFPVRHLLEHGPYLSPVFEQYAMKCITIRIAFLVLIKGNLFDKENNVIWSYISAISTQKIGYSHADW
jgi:hypothetical protein